MKLALYYSLCDNASITMPNQYTAKRGLGTESGGKGKTLRFTAQQIEAINELTYKYPRELRSFADGLRALVVRPSWLTKSDIADVVAQFIEK